MRWLALGFAVIVLAAAGCTPDVHETPGQPSVPGGAPSPAATAPCEGAAAGPAENAADTGVPAPPVAPAPASAPEAVRTEKSEAQKEARKLLAELGEGYIVGMEGPFIVLGNLPEQRFKEIMRYTIRACSDRMYQQYFEKKPDYMLKIYLFGDDKSYRETAKRLWGHEDLSPFGYFSPAYKALIMNIGTGTGTLVHEMFHALVEPDFPDIPAWFNEGVASLYECCQVKSDRLVGMMNWRFPRLQEAVEKDELVPLRDLVATSTRQFYGRGSDLHYAEARYFAMYLQEKGLLEKYYKKFRDSYEDDPTGRKPLEELLGKKIDEIQKDWVKFVKTLIKPRTPRYER